jgi:hypothetical protein
MKYILSTITFIAISAVTIFSAQAQEKDRTFNDWTVYTTTLQGKKTCYMASFPTQKSGNYRRRDEPYLLITRMAPNVYEVSTSSGYPFKNGSSPEVDIDGKKFTMFTQGELAWANSAQQDAEMVETMRKGSRLRIRGTSQIGSYSLDTYSLKGVTASFNRMNTICN